MRSLVLVTALFLSTIAHAGWHQLPDATISDKTIGGSVLLIQMKQNLVISGDLQKKVTSELGEDARKALYKDMIMSKEAMELRAVYGSKEHQATNQLIKMYEDLIAEPQNLSMK